MSQRRPYLQWSEGAAGPVLAALAEETRAPHWSDFAACGETDADAFFPATETPGTTASAKKVCARCFVRQACLDYAVEHGITCGVWGGLTSAEREAA